MELQEIHPNILKNPFPFKALQRAVRGILETLNEDYSRSDHILVWSSIPTYTTIRHKTAHYWVFGMQLHTSHWIFLTFTICRLLFFMSSWCGDSGHRKEAWTFDPNQKWYDNDTIPALPNGATHVHLDLEGLLFTEIHSRCRTNISVWLPVMLSSLVNHSLPHHPSTIPLRSLFLPIRDRFSFSVPQINIPHIP